MFDDADTEMRGPDSEASSSGSGHELPELQDAEESSDDEGKDVNSRLQSPPPPSVAE